MAKNLFPLLWVLLLAACTGSQKPDIPAYPGSRFIADEQMSGKIELEKATVTVAAYEVWENPEKVGEFYHGQLASRPGWTGKFNDEIGSWSDGNIKATDQTLSNYAPIDPSRPGAAVHVYGGEGRSFIQIITSVPKK